MGQRHGLGASRASPVPDRSSAAVSPPLLSDPSANSCRTQNTKTSGLKVELRETWYIMIYVEVLGGTAKSDPHRPCSWVEVH